MLLDLMRFAKASAVYHATGIANSARLTAGDVLVSAASHVDLPFVLLNESGTSKEFSRRILSMERSLDGVVIAAAGDGSRMGELTRDTPKPMLQYEGSFLIDSALELAFNSGFEADDIFVMLKDYSRFDKFGRLEAYAKGYGVQTVHQRSRSSKGHLNAFLRELYGNPEMARAMQPYRRIAFLPADVRFSGDENIKGWIDEHSDRGISVVVTESRDNEGDLWLKKDIHGKTEGFWAKQPVGELPYSLKPLKHNGAYIINMSFMHNPLRMIGCTRTYQQNNGFVPSEIKSVGLIHAGDFQEFNTQQDLYGSVSPLSDKHPAP